MAVTKKAAAKTAETKNQTIQNTEAATVPETSAASPVPEKRTYKSDDVIPCRSVTVGELICESKKHRSQMYRWMNYGDICEVEYQDLLAMRSMKSAFIYNPQFIILDEQLMNDWKLTEIYNQFLGFDNPDELFSLPSNELREKLKEAPEGLKSALQDMAGQYMREGKIDSLSVIKTLDEMLGISLQTLLTER